MRRVFGYLLSAAIAVCGASSGALAQTEAERVSATCERAVLTGAKRGGVPPDVLHAISLTETGRNIGGRMRPWPWAINREGTGHWFATRDEALAFAKASVAEGRTSFDVGCFQINYRWHGDRFPSLEAMFDQDVGGTYAAQFLRSLHAETGSWSAAAGAYHSRTPEFANRYRARFDRLYAGLRGVPLVVAGIEAEAEGEPIAPRKSRTRMSGRPKIINLASATATDQLSAKIATIRVERGKVPQSVLDAQAAEAAEAETSASPVVLSTRDAEL